MAVISEEFAFKRGCLHWEDPEGWYGEGGGFRMGNTCIPVADSFWYMTKPIQYCKVKKNKIKKNKRGRLNNFWIGELSWTFSRFHRWGSGLKSGQELAQLVEDAGEICLPPKSDPILLPSNAVSYRGNCW